MDQNGFMFNLGERGSDRLGTVRWLVLAGLIWAGGCGGNAASVTGVVTLDGKALPPGTIGGVAFHPVGTGPVAVGDLSPSGEYLLHTGTAEGLPAGSYIVTVSASEPPQIPANPNVAPAAPKLVTPVRYSLKEQSGLQVEVKPGENRIPLDLSSR